MRQPYNSYTAFKRVMLREYRRMCSRPIYFYCIVIGPLFCLVFFTTLMKSGLPHDLPVGFVDMDRSSNSRTIERTLDAFDQTGVVAHYANFTDARKAIQRNEIYAFFYIPPHFSRDVQSFRQPKISFYVNYTYLVPGSLILKDMKTMAQLVSGSAIRTQLRAYGFTEDQAMGFIQPIVMDIHPTNNPSLNYAIYLNNTIVPGIFMLLIFLMTVYAIGSEVKFNTARDWLEKGNHSILISLTAKLLPYTIAFFVMGLIYDITFYGLLQYPCNCGIMPMLFAMLCTILASQAFGIILFTFFPVLRLGLCFASLWGVLSFSICGFTYPVMSMAPVFGSLAYLFPLRHYFLIYVSQALDGNPMYYSWENYLCLLLFILLPFVFMIRLKKNIIYSTYIP